MKIDDPVAHFRSHNMRFFTPHPEWNDTPIFAINSPTAPFSSKKKPKRDRSAYYKSSARRQQCRRNQARYRVKQRERQLQLKQSVEQLQQDVKNTESPDILILHAERGTTKVRGVLWQRFFAFFEMFPLSVANAQEMNNHKEIQDIMAVLSGSFAQNFTMGNLQGARAVIQQLRLHSQYFEDLELKLQRIEALTPTVLTAKAYLNVTVVMVTMQKLFPHLVTGISRNINKRRRSLHDRLLGQRLTLNCSMTFLFDEESFRVVRIETSIDWVSALLMVLETLKDVADVLENASITPECAIGCEGMAS
ncbi:LOW QUALITY PROTEIN: Bzip transcription factor [Phytophthora megakarya]|uniref:Bzip transcription factor n=1 Tax=Phytophthora megakarya TaxID=4795 RepID=A0A225UL03_9STRA|nr:LOW QUALITY PROTEIN: Bzip transcription factor [Phytophthora megakarya]